MVIEKKPLAISLAIAPAVFLGNESLFEKLERVILTPDNLFGDLGLGGVDNPHHDKMVDFPLPSFYDFLNLSLSHLPYLSPQHLAILPQRYPLDMTDMSAQKKYHLLPCQDKMVDMILSHQPAVDRLVITILAGLILRSIVAIDITTIDDNAARADVGKWRQQAIDHLMPIMQKKIPLPFFKKTYEIYHLTALHQAFALTHLDIFYRAEQQRKMVRKKSPAELPVVFWLRSKKIHYHLLELLDLATDRRMPMASPFLMLLNLASLTHWLLNSADATYEKIISQSLQNWRYSLQMAMDKKLYYQLRDHYPIYREVLERIDDQLRSIKITMPKIPPKHVRLSHVPLMLSDRQFILSMVGHDKIKKPTQMVMKKSLPMILPWQKWRYHHNLDAVGGQKHQNINNHLMMNFDVVFKKKSFIESGVWLPSQPAKAGAMGQVVEKMLKPLLWKKWFDNKNFYYFGNDIQFYEIDSALKGGWHFASCQKFLLPNGKMLVGKKFFDGGKNLEKKLGALAGDKKYQRLMVERRIFMPKPTSGKVSIKVMETIIAPGGMDFFLLLPLSPAVKAFGKSDSHISDLEQHWQRSLKNHDKDNIKGNKQNMGGVIIEPLIFSEHPDKKLESKMTSLQEVFLQSSDKSGGRLLARGATLSLTKGFFLNNFIKEPCQVMMLSGQTAPGKTIIYWRLELQE
ncbi:MAG: hypothetical protein ACR2NY_00650 [Alphaproteobacteria bacterium]